MGWVIGREGPRNERWIKILPLRWIRRCFLRSRRYVSPLPLSPPAILPCPLEQERRSEEGISGGRVHLRLFRAGLTSEFGRTTVRYYEDEDANCRSWSVQRSAGRC